MRPLILILFIISAIQCSGQTASFKEIKLKPNSKNYAPTGATIIFPIVKTNISKVDSLINSIVKEEVLLPDSINQSLTDALNDNINDYGLINLSYQVTYNRSGLLSFSIYREGCGAYCSSSNIYFNFDLQSGERLSMDDIILKDKFDIFKNMVLTEKASVLNKYKIEEKSSLLNKDIDSTTYDWAISQVDENCMNQISMEYFSITPQSIEIIDKCEFPHAIRSQEPIIELKYSFKTLVNFLTPKFKKAINAPAR